ncbi:MAG: glycosyl hydrolase family 18 protein [Bacillota bacterium]
MKRIQNILLVLIAFFVFSVGTTNVQAATDRTPPTKPTGLAVSSVTQTTVKLRWTASRDNTGVYSYRIYRNNKYIGSTKSTVYTVKGLTSGKSYAFYVKATDKRKNYSKPSATIRVQTLPKNNAAPASSASKTGTTGTSKKDTQAPTAPTSLSVASVNADSASLTWKPSTDNVSVAAYLVYRNSVNIESVSGTSYSATGLTPSTSYSFCVKARDAAGNLSPASNTVTFKTAAIPPIGRIIAGYYASWAAYSGYTPDKIPAAQLTHITYAFANIDDNLKVEMGDPYVDASNFTKLNALKKLYPNIKTLISVGGWDWSGKFSDAALTDASRTAFADSAVAFIKQYGFDGVDIDWEYPCGGGLAANTARPEDKHNFTLLMMKLREKLDVQGAVDGRHYLLTFAGGAGTGYAANTELSLLAGYVDFATVMTYDIHGTWDNYTDFNAPLHTPSEPSPQYKWSVDAAIKLWQSKGFPASKTVMGVPFYGYRYTGVATANNGLYQRFTGGASISYDAIVSSYLNNSSYIRRYHTDARVPWLLGGSTFISYDDPQSIAEKAAYINSGGIAGAAIWELSCNTNGTLLSALYNGLK